ncbi:hypothetical protein DNHGIG_36550 [Collibacillus ludicampi]|uniref:Nucleoside phosphorylase domain-containing protein n=1 Tax=Collibacillus ludicampi TaxID=2771369 RepID=A0AAV4LK40_9BACL|nr:hypothetical protein [Collibacillus ludicampi]GIM48106.1 hypothetical protein DNHGIG_36550 [Collibacillus ludicampi]
MFYFTTALYSEAKPLIDYFQLKKLHSSTRFQIFANEKITLIITGVGIFSASIATAHLLTLNRVKDEDIFINIGICGTAHDHFQIGQPLLCHTIIHHDTNQTFYPDILIKHNLKECALETFSQPVHLDMKTCITGDVVDMEGAACFAAASTFLAPHQIYVLKIVSDFLDEAQITPQSVSSLIKDNIPALERLMRASHGIVAGNKEILMEEDYLLLQQIRDQLHLSVTLYHQLMQLAIQYKIRTRQDLSCLRAFLSVHAESKHEGKMAFAKIKRQLLYE